MELNKSEQIAARVYIRRRRKAWDQFHFMQDLKIGDFLINKENRIFEVLEIREDFYAPPLDIIITLRDVKTRVELLYGFSIKAYEAGLMRFLLRRHEKEIHDFSREEFKLNEQAKVLYGRKSI